MKWVVFAIGVLWVMRAPWLTLAPRSAQEISRQLLEVSLTGWRLFGLPSLVFGAIIVWFALRAR